jgi:hypothetical protein
VKLLLDEMFAPVIAKQLRDRGHDVLAVKERPELEEQPDPVIFAFAQAEGRALVTENVRDFRLLAVSESGGRLSHAGLIFTTDRAFFRGHPRAVGDLVTALEAILNSGQDLSGLEHWLRPG